MGSELSPRLSLGRGDVGEKGPGGWRESANCVASAHLCHRCARWIGCFGQRARACAPLLLGNEHNVQTLFACINILCITDHGLGIFGVASRVI